MPAEITMLVDRPTARRKGSLSTPSAHVRRSGETFELNSSDIRQAFDLAFGHGLTECFYSPSVRYLSQEVSQVRPQAPHL